MRILVADDHEVIRRGVRALLASGKDCEICGDHGVSIVFTETSEAWADSTPSDVSRSTRQ